MLFGPCRATLSYRLAESTILRLLAYSCRRARMQDLALPARRQAQATILLRKPEHILSLISSSPVLQALISPVIGDSRLVPRSARHYWPSCLMYQNIPTKKRIASTIDPASQRI